MAEQSTAKARSNGGRSAVRLPTAQEDHGAPKPARRQRVTGGKRGDDVRARVLRAALECFGAFGFEGTSTRAIADRAHVTHTLVLYHFRSKDQLWIATVQDALEHYGQGVRSCFARSRETSVAAALASFIEQFVRMSAQTPQIHRILTMESNQGTPRLDWVIDHFLRDHFAMVCDLIRRGQEEGKVRACDPAQLYYHIIGAAGTPFAIATEYKVLTGRDIFSEGEIQRCIAFIHEIVFV